MIRRGFTLLELLTVLFIVAVAFAVAAPSFFSRRNHSTDELQNQIARAARTAIRSGAAVAVPIGADSSFVLRVSPLSACTLERTKPSAEDLVIDPLTCRIAGR